MPNPKIFYKPVLTMLKDISITDFYVVLLKLCRNWYHLHWGKILKR